VEKDLKKLQTKLLAGQAKPVRMRVAAALVYNELTGRNERTSPAGYLAALDRTALALSQVSDIYYVSGEGRLLRIPSEELALGVFEGGASVYRTRSGNEYGSLSMRRIDVIDAIVILKKASAVIDGARAAADKAAL
jgi:hypothetical protein